MTASIQPSRAWVEVDLAALLSNARTVQTTAGVPLLPMVKANGYGLGAVAVARALEAVDPWGFGVATFDEAMELRSAGITRPVIVFTPWVVGRGSWVPTEGVRAVIGDVGSVEGWLAAGDPRPATRDSRPFHLEIDTGMSRAGIRWDDRAALSRAMGLLSEADGWEGVFTHFHSADTDLDATKVQWQRFEQALTRLGRRPPMVHAGNSAGALRGASFAGDLVRPGIYLYGGPVGAWAPPPQRVATLKATVVGLRRIGAGESVSYNATWRAEGPTTIATLACGYADGVHRSGSSRIRVELNGVIVPVVGRVAMDMLMVAVADDGAAIGDVATIFGGMVSLSEYADALGTNTYEALTSLGPRVPRVHL